MVVKSLSNLTNVFFPTILPLDTEKTNSGDSILRKKDVLSWNVRKLYPGPVFPFRYNFLQWYRGFETIECRLKGNKYGRRRISVIHPLLFWQFNLQRTNLLLFYKNSFSAVAIELVINWFNKAPFLFDFTFTWKKLNRAQFARLICLISRRGELVLTGVSPVAGASREHIHTCSQIWVKSKSKIFSLVYCSQIRIQRNNK